MANKQYTGFTYNATEGEFVVQTLDTHASNSSSCLSTIAPQFSVYVAALGWYGLILLAYGIGLLLLTAFLYGDTAKYLLQNTQRNFRRLSLLTTAVYPVVVFATINALIVPRAQLVAEAVTQGMFMVTMCQLYILIEEYFGGTKNMLERINKRLTFNVVPCCCCICLHPREVTKKTLRCLKLSVFQLPFVQGALYMLLLVMWAERESLVNVNYIYVQPIVIISIIIGLWGMGMFVNLVDDILPEYLLDKKFKVLRLVLLFSKLQFFLSRILLFTKVLPCNPPFTPLVIANTGHNLILLLEMTILMFCARMLYKRELPSVNYENNNNTSLQVRSLDDNKKAKVNLSFVPDFAAKA